MYNKELAGKSGTEDGIKSAALEIGGYTIGVGVILADIATNITNPPRYRILYINRPFAVLCKMDGSKLEIFINPLDKLLESVSKGDFVIVEDDVFTFDPEKLPENMRREYERNKNIVKAISDEYGPDYIRLMGKKRKPLLDKLASDHGISRRMVLHIIRQYLQSGKAAWSLVNKKYFTGKKGYGVIKYSTKAGRPNKNEKRGKLLTERDLEIFSKVLSWYKSGRCKSVRETYNLMNYNFYSIETDNPDGSITKGDLLLPPDQRPTDRQLQYYISKHTSKEEMDRIKTSAMEVRNNNRLLLSDSRYMVTGPCDRVQVDEVEVDLFVRSSIKDDITVGRPVMYIMLDVYSGIILAVGIGFENNSILGITNCFMNLAEDKVRYCRRFGIEISPRMWPSGCLPKRLLCDRGSEYRSKEMKRICNELGITLEFAPAGTGSLKGCVEQFFHEMHSRIKPHTEGAGLIEKRHDSSHKRRAMLTLDEFTKLALNFILHRNNTLLHEYPLTADMVSKEVAPVPVALWEYGCAKYGSPTPISDLLQFYYTLMLPQKSSFTRRGICCNGLYYCDLQDPALLADMYDTRDTAASFEVRMDPRDIGAIYYLRDNTFHKAPLLSTKTGQADFAGLTLSEWKAITDHLKKKREKQSITDENYDAYLAGINSIIVKNAKERRTTDASDLIESRRIEREAENNRAAMLTNINAFLLEKVGDIPKNFQSLDKYADLEEEADHIVESAEDDSAEADEYGSAEDNEEDRDCDDMDSEDIDPEEYFFR